MENGKKDEEGVNNESHNVGECSESEGHFGDLRKLWKKDFLWALVCPSPQLGPPETIATAIQVFEKCTLGQVKVEGRRPRLGLWNTGATQRGELEPCQAQRRHFDRKLDCTIFALSLKQWSVLQHNQSGLKNLRSALPRRTP